MDNATQLRNVSNELIYPITKTENVIRENGETLETSISKIETQIGEISLGLLEVAEEALNTVGKNSKLIIEVETEYSLAILYLRKAIDGYDCTIDWGDGTIEDYNGNGGEVGHYYEEDGNYTIVITGKKFSGIRVGGERLAFYTSVSLFDNWDEWTNMSNAFNGCYKLRDVKNFDTSNVTNIAGLFSNCQELKSIPFLDTSNVTSMGSAFYKCGFTHFPQIDTSNVTNFSFMFSGCKNLKEIPYLNTSKATDMTDMFSFCHSLKTVPTIDTKNVTSTSGMFCACLSITEIPKIDTSKVTDASIMFMSCESLEKVPYFDWSNLENAQRMFYSCASLKEVGQLNTEKVNNMFEMFKDCNALENLPDINMTSAENVGGMFSGCSELKSSVPAEKFWNNENITSYEKCFYNCENIENISEIPADWR